MSAAHVRLRSAGGTVALALLLASCAAEDDGSAGAPGEPYAGPPLPWAYAPFPAVIEPEDNPSTPEKIALGRFLFYDPVLSLDDATACVTCHSEQWGMSDGLSVSVGVAGEGPIGPGRDGPNKTTRNAQSLWNAAFRAELFWDGRASSLEEQALEPLKAEHELALPPEAAVAKLRDVPAYEELFSAAFPGEAEPVTSQNLARALSAFQRSMVTDRAPYDQYTAGDALALREEVGEGMFLFAEAGCASCHVPPLFESAGFVARIPTADPGRSAVTGDVADAGAFRVPTLRNVREAEPYFHDGSVLTLEEAVAIEAEISAARGEGRALSSVELDRVVKFIDKALTDRSREPDRPSHVPSGLPIPQDGFRIPR